jgi:(3S)-malyl-CoA thioesterase
MVILDLEDAVRDDAKADARAAAVAAVARVSATGCARSASTASNRPSMRRSDAVAGSACDFVVLPKVETRRGRRAVAEAAASRCWR